jgi:predicted nucleic acid-binding protein
VIILDTNVISALMTDQPEPVVARWLDRNPPESVWTTSVTIFELRFGIERLPRSRKRRKLEDQFGRVIHDDIQDRVLALDEAAAGEAAIVSARGQSRGRPVEVRDAMIAGIAISRRAELATRNIRHFGDLGLPVVDPWSA